MNIHAKRDASLEPPFNRHDAMPGDYDDDAPLELWDDAEPRWVRFTLAICLGSALAVGSVIWCVVDWVW